MTIHFKPLEHTDACPVDQVFHGWSEFITFLHGYRDTVDNPIRVKEAVEIARQLCATDQKPWYPLPYNPPSGRFSGKSWYIGFFYEEREEDEEPFTPSWAQKS